MLKDYLKNSRCDIYIEILEISRQIFIIFVDKFQGTLLTIFNLFP